MILANIVCQGQSLSMGLDCEEAFSHFFSSVIVNFSTVGVPDQQKEVSA